MRFRLAVLASGGGSNLQAILDYFEIQRELRLADVCLVISDRANAFALERARSNGLEAIVIAHADSEALLDAITSRDIDLIILAGYLRRLPATLVERFRNRILNVHPAPLPQFGGAGMYGEKLHSAVLASGVTESAVTVHLVNDEFDKGTIIAQWPVPILEGDTPQSLAARVLEVEHAVFPRVIDMVLSLQSLNTIPTA